MARSPHRSTLAVPDALAEVWLDLTAGLARSAFTALGTLIGIAVLVSTFGLAQSAGAHITTRLDLLASTEVVVTATRPTAFGEPPAVPADAPARLEALAGVEHAATLSLVVGVAARRLVPLVDPAAPVTGEIPVVASSPHLPETVRASVRGRFFDRFHDERGEAVGVVGAAAARRLGIAGVDHQPAILLDDRPVTVIGIITESSRRADLLEAVIVPDGFVRQRLGQAAPGGVQIRTRVGAADLVGRQAALALRPDRPGDLKVVVPPSPTITRDRIAADTQALLLVLAAISLVVGGLGIGNATLVSVMERVPEIGLRRAIGARRRHVLTQFLLEGGVIGTLGSVAGASLGVLVTVGVASVNGWGPTLDPRVPVAAVVLGAAIGLTAAAYPATRAARVEPIDALRSAG